MCAGVTCKAGSVILRATSVHLFHVCPAVSWLTGQLLGKRFLILNYTSPHHTHQRSLPPLPWSSHDSLQVSEDPVCIPTPKCLPLQNKFLKQCGRVSSRTGTPVLFTFQPLFFNISSTLPRILSLSKLSTCKTSSSGFASYPHTQSIFKSGRNQGFPLMEESLVFPGSTTSEFREFLPCFQESSPSLYILERRQGGPLGTSVKWLVHDQVLLPIKERLWLAGCSPHICLAPPEVRHTITALDPDCSRSARPSVVLKGQGCSTRYRHPVCPFVFLHWLNIWAKAHPWIHFRPN